MGYQVDGRHVGVQPVIGQVAGQRDRAPGDYASPEFLKIPHIDRLPGEPMVVAPVCDSGDADDGGQ